MKKLLALTLGLTVGLATLAHAELGTYEPTATRTVNLNTKGDTLYDVQPPAPWTIPSGPTLSGSTATSTTTPITKTLSYGMKKDPQVVILQMFLISKGYLVGIADGTFGPKTLAAVKKFQTANSLPPVGIVGPRTRALINAS